MSTGSTITTRNVQNNFGTADIVRSKLFLRNQEFEQGTLLNAGTSAANFAVGTVLARVAATNRLVPLNTAGTDGSQFPVGVLATEVTALAASGTATVQMCVYGDVNQALLVLPDTVTLETVIANKTVRDRLKGDTKGIRPITVDDQTFADN